MGHYELPFIVDSPAGPLDDNVRREIAALVPDFTHQFIAFVISSERGNFVPELDVAAKGDVQYLTMFRAVAETEQLAEKVKRLGGTRTRDGALIDSKDFFLKFDDKGIEDNIA
jgi:DNA sulfur modification protein DndD